MTRLQQLTPGTVIVGPGPSNAATVRRATRQGATVMVDLQLSDGSRARESFAPSDLKRVAIIEQAPWGLHSRDVAAATHITELSIARGGCYGPCPIYEARFSDDGRVTYIGHQFVDRLGVHHGEVAITTYRAVAVAVQRLGFFALGSDYSEQVTDSETVTTSAIRLGRRKEARNYAGAGPLELTAIEHLLDSLLAVTDWES